MKLVKSRTALRRYINSPQSGRSAIVNKLDEPKSYPAYVYETPHSFAYEETQMEFLTEQDLMRMLHGIQKLTGEQIRLW